MFPKRIVSVVPSQTELLFHLGLDEEVVGLTKFCTHPAANVKHKPLVGGTKTLNLAQIHALTPDLILANKEENTREQIEELQQHYPVHITDVNTLPEALTMIRTVGQLVGKHAEAERLAEQINVSFSTDYEKIGPTVAYFIWRKPYMIAANSTFIHSMLEIAGFQNAFAHRTRYPEISLEDLQAAQPDLIFLSSEPYPFTAKHLADFQTICPKTRVILVDGELFSWFGSRLLRSSDYFKNLRNKLIQTGDDDRPLAT